MEEHLRKLVEHAEPKNNFLFIISGRQTKIREEFHPPLSFPTNGCPYEMALIKLETYYSFANIRPENCHFRNSIDKGKTWKLMGIPTGCYEIEAINGVIQRLIIEYGGNENIINLLPNVNTLKCILDIKIVNYQIDFTVDNCLRTVLGFNALIFTQGRHEGDRLVDILDINSILVHCDIIGGPGLNGIEAAIIYNF